jgi:putative peptidoglycan lipid II flippase
VVFGALLHLLVPMSYVIFSGNTPKFTFKINFKEVKETALISIPRALALSVTQIISIVFTAIASFFGVGAVAVFNLAFNLQSVPLSIVGASYSLAAFPTISENYARNCIKECGEHIGESLRYIIFWTLPLASLFIILRAHIVRVVLGSGAFDWTDTKLTAAIMSIFALSFVFQSAQIFLTRAHYALGKTKVPLFWGMSGAFLTVIFAFLLHSGFLTGMTDWFEEFLEIKGLASSQIIILPMSFSFGSMITALGLWFSLNEETKSIAKKDFSKTIFEATAASLVIGFVTFYSLRIFDYFWKLDSLLNVFSHAFISGLVGIMSGILVLYFIKNREFREIMGKFHHE